MVYVIFQEAITSSKNLIDMPVEELAPLLKNKSISPVELTKEVLNHAEKSQAQINAYMAFYRDDAEDSRTRSGKRDFKWSITIVGVSRYSDGFKR